MLARDIKRVLNESAFNPKKSHKILQDVGNPDYWKTKACELILETRGMVHGSIQEHVNLREAITLLAYTRAYYEKKKAEESKEARDNTATKNRKLPKS